MVERHSNAGLTLDVAAETTQALTAVDIDAVAVLQHRRDRDCRYVWSLGTGGDGDVAPPLDNDSVGPAESPSGELSVGTRSLTLSVDEALPDGRYVFQIAVDIDGARRLAPTKPRRLRLTSE